MRVKFITVLAISIFPCFAFSEDQIHCDANCIPKACSELEKFALVNLDLKVREFLSRFVNYHTIQNSQLFLAESARELNEIMTDKKVFNPECLNRYCDKDDNRKLIKILSKDTGLKLEVKNPVCENSSSATPYHSVSLLLKNNQSSLLNILFTSKGPGITLSQQVLTKPCSDNAGGNVTSTFVAGLTGITISPKFGSTPVNSTHTGVQLVRKKKFLPKYKIEDNKVLALDFGENFYSKIDLTNNQNSDENILKNPCKVMIGNNPQKATSRYVLPISSVNTNGLKAFDTNNYKVIDSESSKISW